jgi:hypothetical protein
MQRWIADLAWRWAQWTAQDIAVFVVAIALVCIAVFLTTRFQSAFQPADGGRGPGWQCTYVGKGDAICVKKPI